jgi:hypothetical protein
MYLKMPPTDELSIESNRSVGGVWLYISLTPIFQIKMTILAINNRKKTRRAVIETPRAAIKIL